MALLDVWTMLSAAFVVTTDSVIDVAIIGKESVHINEEFTARVSCNGSSPFNISWNLASLFNRSDVYEDKVLDIDSCNHSIFRKFSSVGGYILTVTIENPVAVETAIFHINATSVMTTTMTNFPSSAAVPVLSVVVAIVAMVALGWSYARSHRAAQVETADFEFYTPSNTSMLTQFQTTYGSMKAVSHNFHALVHSPAKSSRETRAAVSETVELRILLEPSVNDPIVVTSEEASIC